MINSWDIGCIGLILLSTIIGYVYGFIIHSGKWFALILSIFLSIYCIQFLDLYHWQKYSIASGITFTLWSIFLTLLSKCSSMVQSSPIATINQLCGGIGGAVHACIFIIIILYVMQYILDSMPHEVLTSRAYIYYQQAHQVLIECYGQMII